MRKSTDSGLWGTGLFAVNDYHFMKYHQEGDFWTHKPGQTAILKYKYQPDVKAWKQEAIVNSSGTAQSGNLVYDSEIYYIVYNWSGLTYSGTTVTSFTLQSGFNGSLIIPDRVVAIGSSAFVNQTNITQITIPSSVQAIEDKAFSGCINLVNVNISQVNSSLNEIGDEAFKGCENLTAITIPNRVKTIGKKTFQDCFILFNVNIHESNSDLRSIGDKAFSGCETLHSITIPPKVTSIGERAFQHCSILETIYLDVIGPKAPSLGDEAFYNCFSLDSIRVGKNNSINYMQADGWSQYSDKIFFTDQELLALRPLDFGFAPQYHFTEQIALHEFKDLTFETKRLRTGYIEKEYVVLSPRRANAGIAYLEYYFTDPIYRLSFEITLWSGSELLRASDCTALFQVKDANGNWDTITDLLNDFALPTDRNKPCTLNYLFTEPIYEYRFYLTAPSIGASNNSGRLCIGKMDILFFNIFNYVHHHDYTESYMFISDDYHRGYCICGESKLIYHSMIIDHLDIAKCARCGYIPSHHGINEVIWLDEEYSELIDGVVS